MKNATIIILILFPVFVIGQSASKHFVSIQFNTGSNITAPDIKLYSYDNLRTRRSEIKAQAPSSSPRAHQLGFKIETGLSVEKLRLLIYSGVAYEQRFQSAYDDNRLCGFIACLDESGQYIEEQYDFLQIPIGFQYQHQNGAAFFPLIGAEFFHYLALNGRSFEGFGYQIKLGAAARISSTLQLQFFSLYQNSFQEFKSRQLYRFNEWRLGIGMTKFFG